MIVQLMLQIFKISWVHEDRQSFLDSIPFFSLSRAHWSCCDCCCFSRALIGCSMSDIQFELATPNRAVTDHLTGVSGIWGR